MLTRVPVLLYHRLTDESEVELRATVSLVAGTRDELEVEWTAETQPIIDGFDRAAEKAYEQMARESWHDAMEELDQDTEADEATDDQLARYKESREART